MLKDNLLIGQFYPTASFLHRLDARTKILIALIYMIAIFLAKYIYDYLVLFMVLVIAVILSRIPVKVIWKGMRIILMFVIFTVLFNMFLTPGENIWNWGIIKITKQGLYNGIILGARLLFLVAFTSLLTLSTKPIDLTDGMQRLMSPLTYIGVPTYEIALIMSIALRFIPTILEECERIILVQKARGADFHTLNLKTRIKQLMPFLVPLFVSAFRRADELALAMEAKGYFGTIKRRRWKVSRWHMRDTVSLLFFLVIILLIITLRSLIRGA